MEQECCFVAPSAVDTHHCPITWCFHRPPSSPADSPKEPPWKVAVFSDASAHHCCNLFHLLGDKVTFWSFMYSWLSERQIYRRKWRHTERSPHGCSVPSWADLKPVARSFLQSRTWVQGSKVLDHPLSAFPGHSSWLGSRASGSWTGSMWDTSTAPAPGKLFWRLLWISYTSPTSQWFLFS